jgi:uncharacterized delta-60 repeat protein
MIDTLLQVRSNRNNSDCFNLGTGFKTIQSDGISQIVVNQSTIREIKKTQNGSLIIGFSAVNIYDGKPIKPFDIPKLPNLASPAVIKLKTTGEIDNSFFNYGFTSLTGTSDQSVTSIEETTDGKYIIGGNFNSYSGISYNNIIKLNSDGTIDNTFNIGTGFDDIVSDIELQSDGKIIVTGQFTSYSGVSKNRIVRLNSNGTIDNTFNIGTGFSTGTVYDSKIQSDGKIVCVGTFSTYSGSTAGRIIRLNTNGSIDTTFNSGQVGFSSSAVMLSVELQSDGKILVGGGGNITTYNGVSYPNKVLFRLNTNGSIDSSFMSNVPNIGINGLGPGVSNIAIQSNGKILSYSSQNILSRLNSDGTLDIIVNNNNNVVTFIYFTESLLIDGDKLYVPLNFLNGEKSTGLFRLNLSDLSSDTCVIENNQYLDLYDDVSVNLNMSFSEIQDITSKNSGYSQSFRLPGTKDNNTFFNYMFDVNADNLTFNIQQSVPCTLSYKGETVLDGTLRLLKIYINNNSVDYEVNIQDEVGLLINDISNKSLYDLDYIDLNHTYNSSNVLSSWNATYTGGTTTGGLKDGKILYGFSHNGYIYDKSGTTVTTGSNASPLLELSGLEGTISYSGTPMRTTGFKPSIQIYDVTRRIFEQNGYTLESDFFETEYFQRLYMPLMFVADQYYISSSGATDGTSQIVLSQVRPPIGFDFSGGTCGGSSYSLIDVWCPLNQLVSNNGPVYPSSGWNLGSGTFHAWSGGNYVFDFKARISIPFGPQGAQGEIYLCKNLDTSVRYGSIPFALEGSFNTQEDVQNTGISITLAPGDTINLVMRFYIAPVGCITGYELIQPDFQITETSVIVVDAPNLIVGSTVDVKEQFTPEYKQLDFLKGLMTQFNLVFVKHPFKTKTYIMEPFEDYVGQGKLLDWTTLIDRSKDITISPITNINGKAINFLYQDEADAMNTFTKSINNNRIFGTYNFIPIDTKINDQPINITSFFSPTPCDTLPFADILPQPFIVPHLYGAKESTKEGVTNTQLLPMRLKPRILHYYGLQPLSSTWYYLNDSSGNTLTQTSYPLIHHQNRIPSISDLGTAIDLNFGNSASPQDNVVPTTTTNTGYALYYEDYVNDLLSTDARMLTAYFNLNVTDINNLEYKDLIFIKDAYYRVNKIENFSLIESSVTKVELVKLLRVDINYDCTIDATVELYSGTPSGSCCVNPFTLQDLDGNVCDVRTNGTASFYSGTTVSVNPIVSGTTAPIYYTWNAPTTISGSTTGGTANLTPTLAPFTLGNITNTNSTESYVRYSITGSTADGFCTDVFTFTLEVSELPLLTSTTTPAGITGGTTFNYTITSSNLSGGTISWTRPAFGDNAASSGTTSSISEVLINTGTTTLFGVYTVKLTPESGCFQTYTVTVPVYSSTYDPPTGDTYNYYLVYRVEYPYSVKWTLSSSVGDDSPAYHVTVPFDIGNMVDNDLKYYVQYNIEPTQLVGCYILEMTSTNTCSHPSVIPGDSIVNVSNVSIENPNFVNTSGSIWQRIDGEDTYNLIIMPVF